MVNKLFPIAICFFIFTLNSFSQSYRISIDNGEFIGDNKYEFDVIIRSTKKNFELTSYQASLVCNVESQHEITFSYINGSSGLDNYPSVAIGTLTGDNGIRMLTFASLAGNDIISENDIKVGRFLLTSDMSLKSKRNFIFWNFDGNINTILTGSGFTDITSGGIFRPANGNRINLEKEDIINVGGEEIIQEFELLQNYPNPFNPSTTIKYKIPFDSSVKLKVFNLLGEEVKTLVDDFLSTGSYEIKFDAESLPSGYYIYSLYVDNKIFQTKKMVLIK